MNIHPLEIFRRHKSKPSLTATNWQYQANSVLNPQATLLADGTTLPVCRVDDRRDHSIYAPRPTLCK
ncbi:MAG TPA: hypothetical protein VFR47_18405 [Anaerolineales bacterium]|nr:hypothetical protein [Anaerolineales bacterium]